MRRGFLIPTLLAVVATGAVVTACSTSSAGTSSRSQLAAPDRIARAEATPHATHVTVIVMENRDEDRIVGSPKAPFMNGTLIPAGALLANSHAVGHPSEPNYLALFSGSTHGLHGDPCPENYHSANIASELIAKGLTFGGYSESMPYVGFTGCGTKMYARKHNPWVMFDTVPTLDNRIYHRFPNKPPSLTFIVPNLCNDMHDCTIPRGDKWLSNHLPEIMAWDKKNDGLLIVTWDEADPDVDRTNHIPTFMAGPMVVPGSVSNQDLDHYSVLKTMESIFGVGCISSECRATPIAGIWK